MDYINPIPDQIEIKPLAEIEPYEQRIPKRTRFEYKITRTFEDISKKNENSEE